jgi:polar amino acid transport system ATP-binding protein/sulfate transport system ATP-binding protein/NitT/TauT family transport system ATP-binding protein
MTYTKEEVLLKAEHVHLQYNNKQILRDINFEVKNVVRPGCTQGQVISLIGRSGIGKTQFFKLLSGLSKPTSGKLLIQNDMPVKAGDMGVVFQNYYLFEWRTIHQSLELAAKKNPALKDEVKTAIEKYAEDFNLSEHLQKYPKQLSGGQRQRVSIIQQMLNGSDFLLLDEPFSGLDVIVLDKVVDLLLEVSLSDELKTLIIVSHDIETAIAISDTVFVLGCEPGKEGATIKKEIDLGERDLAWQKNVREQPAFTKTIKEIKSSL